MINAIITCDDYRPRVLELLNTKDHKKIDQLLRSTWKFLDDKANENLKFDSRPVVRISECMELLKNYNPSTDYITDHYIIRHAIESRIVVMKVPSMDSQNLRKVV